MVVKATPSASFKMSKADLLLELEIVALNAPPKLGRVDQTTEADILG